MFCLRLIVESWTDSNICCRVPAQLAHPVGCVADTLQGAAEEGAGCRQGGCRVLSTLDADGCDAWSYLLPHLWHGAVLNAVNPRESGGMVVAELVVLEPDYLVDISAVAACFTPYAEGPVVHLLARIAPREQSQAIMMGHLAGQMLDEALHAQGAAPSYADSVRTFFARNAMQVATTDIRPDFHVEGRRQRATINAAIRTELPRRVAGYDTRECVVEPSFFSETLGLQGRMDMLQRNIGLIVEQKSGRGAFVPNDTHSDVPVARLEHRVQLLLYMLLLQCTGEAGTLLSDRGMSAFLLYSHYTDSLVPLHIDAGLTRRAMRVRNLIAWQERLCAMAGGYRRLATLTADDVNERGVCGRLWEHFQRPRIESLLAPVHKASALEQDYYFCMLAFVAREHWMAKVGTRGNAGQGFAAKWLCTHEEKAAAGEICDRLTIAHTARDEQGKMQRLTLDMETDGTTAANFRRGDIVVLYKYDAGGVPDVRRQSVLRATIESIDGHGMTLWLRNAQTDERVFGTKDGERWAVEHDFFDSSFAALYEGLHAFLAAPQQRRDLLMLQRPPRVDTTATLRGSGYGDFTTMVQRCREAQDIFLIVGPPGTGKTSFGLMLTLREHLLDADARVLLMAYTNRAVDEICSHLVAEGIAFMRFGNSQTCDTPYWPHLASTTLADCTSADMLRARLKAARVVVGTVATMSAMSPLFKLLHFDVAIIDEASQLLEPHLLKLLAAHSDNGTMGIDKVVMIGDDRQLPAVVMQDGTATQVQEESLRAIGLTDCRCSLFERLLRRYGNHPAVTFTLTRQGRMHHDIAAFPNAHYYGGILTEAFTHQSAPLPPRSCGDDALLRQLCTHRMLFIDVDGSNEAPDRLVNEAEAAVTAGVVERIARIEQEHFDAGVTVGIIVPYRNQIAAVRAALRTDGCREMADSVCIDTVERFQGSQRKYIVYGTTVHTEAQLDFITSTTFNDHDGHAIDRKLNVAITRAQEHLIIVGNAQLLEQRDTTRELVQHCKRTGSYVHA